MPKVEIFILEDVICQKLEEVFQPEHLQVINESALHKGHAGDDGSGESHFRVEMTSAAFKDKTRVERQRMVHAVLKEELAGPVHALALKLSEG